ncbi:MAG: alpha/beta fold hydrolase [Limisphaerales bacterium]
MSSDRPLLNFQSRGQGPPLVILHGLFGSLDNWHTVSNQLAGHFQVLVLDQRNHGRSFHSPDMDYPLMASDLARVLDSRGLGRASVLGHSMGGKTAMEFALRWPARVDRLVVVDVAPRAYPPRHQPILDALLSLDLRACGSFRELETALAPAVPDKATRQFLLKGAERDAQGRFQWRMNVRGIADNYERLCQPVGPDRQCSRPALFIRGERSDALLPEDFDPILRLFPQARFRPVAGAGHWVHADAPGPFVRSVLEFFQEPEAANTAAPAAQPE